MPTTTPDTLIYRSRVSPEFAERLSRIGEKLPLEPDFLMACMAFETGLTFSASVKNPRSSATGLIQFMATTARGLGTTVQRMARMSEVEQLGYVETYFRRAIARHGPIRTLEDCYMAILWPAAIGKQPGYVLFRAVQGQAYRVNAGLDANRDGAVTVAEATMKVRRLYQQGRLQTRP